MLTSAVGSMGVRAYHEQAREGVVLQQDLVDDSRAWLPEPNTISGASRGEEVVHLRVDVLGTGQILGSVQLKGNNFIIEKIINNNKI